MSIIQARSSRPSRLALRFFLALAGLATLATAAAAEPCPEVPGLAELDGADVVMLGEIHGSDEIPRFVGDLVCAASATRPVLLGLEIPAAEDAAFQAYLASTGDAPARRTLLATPFFSREYQDGRSSRAMLELLERVRALRAAGRDVELLAFDDPDAPGGRDRAMADRLLAARAARPGRLVVALAGNLHARIVLGSPFDPRFESMALFLLRAGEGAAPGLRLLSLDARYPDGTAWTCTTAAVADCGARRLRGAEAVAPGIRLDPVADGMAYHGVFAVAALTASPPAKEPEPAAVAPPEPLWKGSVSLAYFATSGNAETGSLGSEVAFERRPVPWGFKIGADFARAEQNSEETAERYSGRFRAERLLDERWSLFGGLSGERDRFAGLDLRAVLELGATRRLLTGPVQTLSVDGGLTWTREDRSAGGDDDALGALFAVDHAWQIRPSTGWTQRLAYFPSFADADDWRLTYKASLAANISRRLALKVGYELRYDHEPVPGFDDTDTTLSTSLVVTFPPSTP